VKIRDMFARKGRPLDNLRTVHGIGYEYAPNESDHEYSASESR
jgi:hypothetical protein